MKEPADAALYLLVDHVRPEDMARKEVSRAADVRDNRSTAAATVIGDATGSDAASSYGSADAYAYSRGANLASRSAQQRQHKGRPLGSLLAMAGSAMTCCEQCRWTKSEAIHAYGPSVTQLRCADCGQTAFRVPGRPVIKTWGKDKNTALPPMQQQVR